MGMHAGGGPVGRFNNGGGGPMMGSGPQMGQSMMGGGQQDGDCVAMVYGIDHVNWNCDKIFNILCLYGNVLRVGLGLVFSVCRFERRRGGGPGWPAGCLRGAQVHKKWPFRTEGSGSDRSFSLRMHALCVCVFTTNGCIISTRLDCFRSS